MQRTFAFSGGRPSPTRAAFRRRQLLGSRETGKGTMRTSLFSTLAFLAAASVASAQTAGPLRLTVDEAVKMALDSNIDLAADRLDPQISDTRVAASAGLFRPTIITSVNSNNQLQPPSSFLIPTATRTDVVTSNAGF